MEKLISNSVNSLTVPESYTLPPEKRPGDSVVPFCKTIPVVDLGGLDRAAIVRQISKAGQEYGFFQVVNHGITTDFTNDMHGVARKFFEMPVEDRAKYYSEDPSKVVRVFTSINVSKEKNHFWRDTLMHQCHPVDDSIHLWPEKPTNYREVTARYCVEVRGLALRLLEMISEALGLEADYLSGDLSDVQVLSINHYPACPDPSLTLGLPPHCDPGLFTILLESEVRGLQVMKDGNWVALQPIPNAFVVNIAHQLQIISNGKFKSVEHRVVTNSTEARTSVITFIYPTKTSLIAPASSLLSVQNPPLYKSFKYLEFFKVFLEKEGDTQSTVKAFQLQS